MTLTAPVWFHAVAVFRPGPLTRHAFRGDPDPPAASAPLANAAPVLARRPEVWLSGRNEHWTDGRADRSDLGLSVLFDAFAGRAKVVAKAGRTWRAGGHDDQAGLEVYLRLWKGAYGYADLSVSPRADFAPRSSCHLEVYQSVLRRFELSLGLRRMKFPGDGVTLLAGSAAGCWERWYGNIRALLADAGAGSGVTWMAGLRRYFSASDHVWATFGRGARAFEAGALEDILVAPHWFAEGGADLYVFRDFKLRGSIGWRGGRNVPSSTALGLTAGYRW